MTPFRCVVSDQVVRILRTSGARVAIQARINRLRACGFPIHISPDCQHLVVAYVVTQRIGEHLLGVFRVVIKFLIEESAVSVAICDGVHADCDAGTFTIADEGRSGVDCDVGCVRCGVEEEWCGEGGCDEGYGCNDGLHGYDSMVNVN